MGTRHRHMFPPLASLAGIAVALVLVGMAVMIGARPALAANTAGGSIAINGTTISTTFNAPTTIVCGPTVTVAGSSFQTGSAFLRLIPPGGGSTNSYAVSTPNFTQSGAKDANGNNLATGTEYTVQVDVSGSDFANDSTFYFVCSAPPTATGTATQTATATATSTATPTNTPVTDGGGGGTGGTGGTATPEAPAGLLFGVGMVPLAGLAAWRRRRNQRSDAER